jgi:hypothetical protein
MHFSILATMQSNFVNGMYEFFGTFYLRGKLAEGTKFPTQPLFMLVLILEIVIQSLPCITMQLDPR